MTGLPNTSKESVDPSGMQVAVPEYRCETKEVYRTCARLMEEEWVGDGIGCAVWEKDV